MTVNFVKNEDIVVPIVPRIPLPYTECCSLKRTYLVSSDTPLDVPFNAPCTDGLTTAQPVNFSCPLLFSSAYTVFQSV